MRVSLATHGGLAAGLRLGRQPLVVDTSDLSESDAAELARLVTAARGTRAPPDRSDRARDAMTYVITVENGAKPVVLRQSDTAMTEEFSELLRWLQEHSPEALL